MVALLTLQDASKSAPDPTDIAPIDMATRPNVIGRRERWLTAIVTE